MEALLLESAKAWVQVRNAYGSVKRDPMARYYTYTLLLQRGKFYVGSTDNIFVRLVDHMTMSPSSSLWVREHGPVSRVVEIVRNSSRDDERYKTLEYMNLMGWENVRGAAHCRVDMRTPPSGLGLFCRDRADFEYVDRREINEILKHVAELSQSLGKVAESPESQPE
jgi:hypothetical protein